MKNGPKNSEYVQYPKETSLFPKMISRHKDKYHKNVALKLNNPMFNTKTY